MTSKEMAVLAVALLMGAPPPSDAADPVATFSIVAYEPATAELGIAVQSKFFAVGAVVPWARAGVGAVATQAFANTTYGPQGLRLLGEGLSPTEALETLLDADDDRDRRQVGIVDANGSAAAFTGPGCMAWAGHVTGENYTAQGNILTGEEVVLAMAKAFEGTEGILGERLMSALEAGQSQGGDSRGMQSAAILIVKQGAGYAGYNDRYCDLRVDDHLDPIAELRRIFDMWKIDALIHEGYRLVEEQRYDEAFRLAQEAARLEPGNGEVYYHWACYLSRGGESKAALERLSAALRLAPSLAQQAREDPDLAPLRAEAEFRRIVDVPSD